jgi:lambda family phage portal protein
MGMIETPDLDTPIGEKQDDGTQQMELSPAMIERLGPGEKFSSFMPNRPNTAIDPFMRYMLREVAAGLSISYESLSRDYSQSNYSSSRLSLIDDRDVWRQLQQWFIRSFREPLHREWLQAAVLAGAIPEVPIESYAHDPEKFRAVSFKPRGWSWIDPTKEVEAYREAVRCGFTTVGAVISTTGDGRDLEDVLTERRAELDQMAAADLVFDTDPSIPAPSPMKKADQPADTTAGAAPTAAATNTPAGDAAPARVVNLRK